VAKLGTEVPVSVDGRPRRDRVADRDDREEFVSDHGRDCESQSRTLDDKGKT